MTMNKMGKTYLNITMCVLAIIAFLCSSCASTRTLTISGTPGTEIFYPDGTKLGAIEQNGSTKIKIDVKKRYYPYLLGKSSNYPNPVPFALDVEYKSNAINQIMLYGGSTLGPVSLIEGPVLAACGSPAVGIPLAVVGAVGTTAIFFCDYNATDVQHSFRYTESCTDDKISLSTSATIPTGERKIVGSKQSEPAKKTTKKKNADANVAPDGDAFQHTVADGETLSSIAQQYGVSISDIIKANGLKGNQVQTGQKLVIPL